MSTQSGRGGMGIHKHGVSGHPGSSPKYKFGRVLDANKEIRDRALKKPKTKMFTSVKEAFASTTKPPHK